MRHDYCLHYRWQIVAREASCCRRFLSCKVGEGHSRQLNRNFLYSSRIASAASNPELVRLLQTERATTPYLMKVISDLTGRTRRKERTAKKKPAWLILFPRLGRNSDEAA